MTYLVDVIPEYLRDSHTAAGNSGTYPSNGAIRRLVADPVESEWIEIVRRATASDIEEYPWDE